MSVISIDARPYEFRYDPKETALILIDFQRDFLLKGGYGELLSKKNNPLALQVAVKPTKDVLWLCREYDLAVFHTREGHDPDLKDCPDSKRHRGNLEFKIGDMGPMGRIFVRGQYGNGIIEELEPIAGEPVIDKPGKGAFYSTDLDDQLKSKNIRSLIVTGVTTEVCVQSTIREANDRGYECLLLEDCVASYNVELHEAALKMIISQGGIFGWVTDSTAFLNSLRQSISKQVPRSL